MLRLQMHVQLIINYEVHSIIQRSKHMWAHMTAVIQRENNSLWEASERVCGHLLTWIWILLASRQEPLIEALTER